MDPAYVSDLVRALRKAVYQEIVHGDLGQVESGQDALEAWEKLEREFASCLRALADEARA